MHGTAQRRKTQDDEDTTSGEAKDGTIGDETDRDQAERTEDEAASAQGRGVTGDGADRLATSQTRIQETRGRPVGGLRRFGTSHGRLAERAPAGAV
jgi:hypothetical protein